MSEHIRTGTPVQGGGCLAFFAGVAIGLALGIWWAS